MEVGIVLAIIFIIVTVLFMVLAFFLPEWVGIQGKKAQSIEETHRENSLAEDDLNKK